MNPVQILEDFLGRFCLSDRPLLLALSGGSDSLCLFYALLEYQKCHPIAFHIAHINHGWRVESSQEAIALERLANHYGIPFHGIRLDLSPIKGNLENISRQARYQFFSQLCAQFGFQAVLLGHHRDDQVETVLKRVLEGAHWSHCGGLKPSSTIYGICVLRPFLKLTKKQIRVWLQQQDKEPFEDATNFNVRFLRARMRKRILPYLSREFGKEVEQPLIILSEETQELADYFDEKIKPFIENVIKGPLGVYLDLANDRPCNGLEIKYLIRKFLEKEKLNLSRAAIDSLTQGIMEKAANRPMNIKGQTIWVDRQRLFIPSFSKELFSEPILLTRGCVFIPNWIIEVKEGVELLPPTSWREGWLGVFKAALPREDGYYLSLPDSSASYQLGKTSISKWWNQHKIPAFLRSVIPVIWHGKTIYHEFLTGRSKMGKSNTNLLEVTLKYQHKEL